YGAGAGLRAEGVQTVPDFIKDFPKDPSGGGGGGGRIMQVTRPPALALGMHASDHGGRLQCDSMLNLGGRTMNPIKSFGVIGGAIQASVTDHPAIQSTATVSAAPPVVTISRQAGIETSVLTAELADRLNNRSTGGKSWKSYDQQLIDQVAREHHLSRELVASHDEHDESIIELAMHGLGGGEPAEAIAMKIAETIRHLGDQGQAIVVGRGGQSILALCEGAVHVRLIAPEPWRADRLAEKAGLDRREALKTLRRIDVERTKYMKAHFNLDQTDPLLYGIILNMAQIGVAQACEAIVSLVPSVATTPGRG
ncbi:MAG: cytidylate kinase-like family protein, partial [Planctomycetota bacterium]|nr:cytidylate kinase-like family protein [Planctomycetota bacterium]